MKIAIVTESFLPQVNGVTNSVLRVLEYLESQGHQALVIAPESDGDIKDYRGFKVKRIPAIPIHSVLPIGMPFGLPVKRLEYLLEGFAPDVVHLASPLILGGYAAKVCKKLNIPTVSIYQTDIAGFARHYGLSAAHSSLRKLVGRIHSSTTRTLAPSSSAVNELTSLGVENVHLWRRGVNSILFHPSARSDDMRASFGAPHKLIVGYVGRLANEKRLADLQVLDADSRVQLVLVGEGPARTKLERQLPNAIFAGFQSGAHLAQYYASFDLFIHPGPNETFCQAVQEALASGVPCIVPQTGGPADLVAHTETGFVIDTSNSHKLLNTLEYFLYRADRSKMKICARNSVEHRTWVYINEQLIHHYQDVITRTQLINKGSAA